MFSTLIAVIIGLPFGLKLGLGRFGGRRVMLTAANATLQASLAAHWGGNYGAALAVTAAAGAAVLCVLAWIGPENREGDLRTGETPTP